MKKLVLAVTAATAAIAVATPAFAAAPSGARIEGMVGYDRTSIDLDEFGLPGFDLKAEGVVFGIGAGYDMALGEDVALGVDVEATETTADVGFSEGTDAAEISFGRDLYAGFRLTVPAGESMNMYLKAGYTNARVKGETTDAGVTESASGNLDGVRAGLGLQFAVGANSYVGVEYRYSNYEADVIRHQGMLNFGFRF
jgi:outer membrane immunogenic protein